MSHILGDVFHNCPNLYAGLMDYFQTCPPNAALSEQIPHAEFLLSAANRNGLAQTIHPSDNKVRKVTVGYQPRFLESEVTENGIACEGTTVRGRRYAEYDIDTTANIFVEGFLASTKAERQCENTTQYVIEQLALALDALERVAAGKIATQSVALAGGWGSDHPAGLIVADKLTVNTQVKTLISATTFTHKLSVFK